MDQTFDRHLQRIIDETNSNDQTAPQPNLNLPLAEGDDWLIGLGIPPLPQDLLQHSAFGRASNDTSSQFQPSFDTAPGPVRLSLAPRNTYNENTFNRNTYNQIEESSRTLNNADNYFNSIPISRQGISSNQSIPGPFIPPSRDSINNLADNMLMQSQTSRPVYQYSEYPQYPEHERLPESNNSFPGVPTNSLSYLQPQRQQVTTPFRLSGLAYNPIGQDAPESSSPMTGSASSPTTRVSLRRASHQSTMPNCYRGEPQTPAKYLMPEVLELPKLPQTPQRQNPQQATHTSQTLDLPHAPPMVQGIPLLSPHGLPDRFRHLFPYKLFNAVQSKCFPHIYKSNDNVVISAPTGSGKTVLLELAICKLVEAHQSGQFKIVYQAPTKSLCSERLRDWEKKFSHLNLPVAELTGDTTQAEMARVRNASIIVTTPEKWDSITRKWTDHAKLIQLVKLFLIDEVHILKDTRGATLEAVVSRMKSMGTDVRFVAISATVPNSCDIAMWLGRDHTNQHLPAHREEFGDSFRPVRIVKWVCGFDGSMNDFAFEKTLDGKLPAVIQQYSEKKPIMVFCFTRKSCETSARILAEHWTRQKVTDRAWPAPTKRPVVGSKELQDLVTSGVAFHHAGLDPQDRHAIETAFLKGDISVICCTSTLAVGVNLPCHLVILKGTVGFQEGKLTDYSDLDVMQMLGRAGRPQFDNKAVAVIMTRSEKVERYKRLISGQEILESTLHLNLIEHLNSEVSLGIVNDLHQAKRWINGTFLAVRMRQNPDWYKMDGVMGGHDATRRLELVCERDIKLLQVHGLVSNDERFRATVYGKAMSHYMVQFETMKAILSLPRQAKLQQILKTISEAVEFKDLRIKPAERPFLRDFNKSPFLKYPLKENISLTSHKIYLMFQVQLGGFELPPEKDFNAIKRQFITETNIIFERAQRLIRCVIDCKASECDAVAVRHGLDLARSFSARYWENSNLQLRQIPQLGPVGHRKLINSDINTIEKFIACENGTIERIMSKNPPYGKKMKDILLDFPRLSLVADITEASNARKGKKPTVKVLAHLGFENSKVPVWTGRKPSVTFMAETTDGTLVHIWRGNIMKLENTLMLKFSVDLPGPAELITCRIACEEIVGTAKTCVIHPNIPASAFPPPVLHVGGQVRTAISNATGDQLDDFGDDEVADDDMVAAIMDVEATSNRGLNNEKHGPVSKFVKATAYDDPDEFADIDDFERSNTATKAGKGKKKSKDAKEEEESNDIEKVKSVQMSNGRWTCHHVCRDGLKNGRVCKHRCCTEGLEGPRTVMRKVSKGRSYSDQKPVAKMQSKASESVPGVRLKSSPLDPIVISDSESDGLTEVLPPVPYAQVAPRESRKLHELHTKVQSDNPIRLPKVKPKFSYSDGEKAELPFLQKRVQQSPESAGSPESEELKGFEPTGSLHDDTNIFDNAFFDIDPVANEDMLLASFQDGSMYSLETGMVETETATLHVVAQPTSNHDSSFPKELFDYPGSRNLYDAPRVQSNLSAQRPTEQTASGSTTRQSFKRHLSPDRIESTSKHLRLSDAESATHLSHRPGWTNDVDQNLIDLLGDSVDYVD